LTTFTPNNLNFEKQKNRALKRGEIIITIIRRKKRGRSSSSSSNDHNNI
jgi:hypothetical protein